MKKNKISLLCYSYINYREFFNTLNQGIQVDLGNDYPYLEDLYYTSSQNGNKLLGVFKEKLSLNNNLFLLFSFYNEYVEYGEKATEHIKFIAEDFTQYMKFVGLNSTSVEDIIDIGARYINDKVDDCIYFLSHDLKDITPNIPSNVKDELDRGFDELNIRQSVEYIEKLFKEEDTLKVDDSVINKINLDDIRDNSVEDNNEVSTEDVINKFNKQYGVNSIITKIRDEVQSAIQEILEKNLKGDDDKYES